MLPDLDYYLAKWHAAYLGAVVVVEQLKIAGHVWAHVKLAVLVVIWLDSEALHAVVAHVQASSLQLLQGAAPFVVGSGLES